MNRYKSSRRVQIDDSQLSEYDDADEQNGVGNDDERGDSRMRLRQSGSNVSEDQEPFMGVKVRRKASLHRDVRGDYLGVPSHPHLMKILYKQGSR